ncbi:hypothetical protein FGG78_41440 [Thioclava sp. BHET1]|nr:hypothetical protein FGG78_41440 [Thioclava sp. BHET1]
MSLPALTTATADPDKTIAHGGWRTSGGTIGKFLRSFEERGAPEASDFQFDWQRRRIAPDWHFDHKTGFWRHAKFSNRRSYVLPDRFPGLF